MDANKGSRISVIENLEPRLMLSGSWDNISEIFIEQGNFYHPDMDGVINYDWEIGFEALPSSVTSARFRPDSVADGWVDITEMDDLDGNEEWSYELSFTDPQELASYLTESFVLEITFATSEVLSTSIALEDGSGTDLEAPTQYPEFISPYQNQSGIAVNTTIVWQEITDTGITAVELNIGQETLQGYADVAEFELDPSASYSSAISLAASSIYSAELVYDNAYTGTTADGVATFASRYNASAVNFNTYTGLLDNIDSAFIERGYSSTDQLYSFCFGFESTQADWFTSAQLLSPSGDWTYISDYDSDVSEHEWSTEFVNSDVNTVDATYPYGMYALDLYFNDGVFARTMFDFSNPSGNTGDPLTMPIENPAFLAPADNATDVAVDQTFSWQTITDTNISGVEFYVGDQFGGTVIDADLNPTATEYIQNQLISGTTYYAELEFWNDSGERFNADSISYSTNTFTQASIEFTTAGEAPVNVWQNVTDAHMEVGVVQHEDSTTEYVADFSFSTPNSDWLTQAELIAPGGNVYSLSEAANPIGGSIFQFMLASSNQGDVTDFASGTFTLRITLPDNSTVETDFDMVLNTVTDVPVITSPASQASDVDVNSDLSWNASSDTSIDGVRVSLFDVTLQQGVIDLLLQSDATGFDLATLTGESNYALSVGFVKSHSASNTNGIAFTCDYVNTSDISFTTAAESSVDVWQNIDGAFMDQGVTRLGDGSDMFWMEFGFHSSSSDWLTDAHLITPDSTSFTLIPQTPEDPQDTGIEYILELESSNQADLSSFGSGTYTLQIRRPDSSVVETTFDVGSVVAPTQVPAFTNISNNDTGVAADISFMWQAVTDSNVDTLWLEVDDTSGNEIIDVTLSTADTQFDQSLLSGLTGYTALLGFVSSGMSTNADGIVIGMSSALETEVNFTTAEGGTVNEDFALTQVNAVSFSAGMIESSYGTDYAFEMLVNCASSAWCETIEASFDGGTTWAPFYPHFDTANVQPGDVFDWGLDFVETDIANLASYLNGTTQIRFSRTGETPIVTEFAVTGLDASITDVPTFTKPLQDSTDFATNGTFSWNLPNDSSVTDIVLDVYQSGGMGVKQIFGADVGSYTLSDIEQLLADTTCEAELTFVAAGSSASNTDGVAYTLGNFRSSMISFMTAAESGNDVWQNVDGAFMEQGVTRISDGSDMYWAEFGFHSSNSDWLLGAHLITPDSTSYTLAPKTSEDSQDTGIEYILELESNDSGVLSSFGAGTYTLQVMLADSSTVETSFNVTDLPQLAEIPVFTNPLDGATDVATDLTFQWNAPQAGTVDEIVFEIEDESGDMDLWEGLSADTTQYAQNMLMGATNYNALLGFANYSQYQNSDGLVLMTAGVREAEVFFTTVDNGPTDPVLANISDVGIAMGATTLADGTTEYEIEMVLVSSTNNWFATAEIYAGGQWLQLTADPQDGSGTGDAMYTWSLGVSDTNMLNLMPYASGSYTLRFTLDDSSTVTTDFSAGTIGIGVSQVPQFTSPLNGDDNVSQDATFTWQTITDAAVTGVELELTEDFTYSTFKLPVDMQNNSASTGDITLMFAQQYSAILTFMDEGQWAINSDGVSYHVDTYQASEINFTTSDNPLMNIGGMAIEQGTVVAPDGTVDYWFEAEFETFSTDWFTSARIQGPDSSWYDLALTDQYDDGQYQRYGYGFETFSADSALLNSFGDGTYTLEITLSDSSVVTTSFDVSGVADVAQVPEFTSPMDDATGVDPDTLFSWQPVTDTNVSLVELMVEDDQMYTWVDTGFDPSAISYQPQTLDANTHYVAELCFINENVLVNNDGISFMVARGSDRQIDFTTSNGIYPAEHIVDIAIQRGQSVSSKGNEYGFEFIIEMDEISFFDTIEFKVGTGQWHQLYQFTQGYSSFGEGEEPDFEPVVFGFEQYSSVSDDLNEYADGVYTLRFTLPDATTYETTLGVAGLLSGVSQQPEFTNPVDMAAEVPVDTSFSWQQVTDTEVTGIGIMVETSSGIRMAKGELANSATSYTPAENLLAGVDYLAELVFFGGGDQQLNDDNIGYSVNTYSSSEIEFSSAGSLDITTLMQDVYFDQGIVQIGEFASESGRAETEYFFEFGFSTDTANWFDYASITTPSAVSYTIMQFDYENTTAPFEWGFEMETTDMQSLSDFGAGVYTLELSLISGQLLSMDFTIDAAQLDMVEAPQITSPADGEIGVPVAGAVQWNLPTDQAVTSIYAEIYNVDNYETVLELDLTTDNDAMFYSSLDEFTGYKAGVEFVGTSQAQNTNGVNYSVNSISASQIRFTTVNPWSDLAMFNIDRGVVSMDDGAHYVLNAAMVLSGEVNYDFAILTSPDGTTINFAQIFNDTTNDGSDVFKEGETITTEWKLMLDTTDPVEALSFGVGTYTLTIGDSVAGVTMSTEIYFDSQLAAPSQIPNITSPVDGSTDVAIDTVFAWDEITDTAVSNILFTMWGYGGEQIDYAELGADQSSYQRGYNLNFANDYTVEVAIRNSQQSTNDDEVYYTISNFTASQSSFSTLLSNLSVAEHIMGLEFYAGQAQTNDGSVYNPGMVRLMSDTNDWADMIEFSADGQSWLELDQQSYGNGSYGYTWSLFTTLTGDMTDPVHMRFTLPGGEIETTTFTLDMISAAMPSIPQITTPSADATDQMDPEELITWQAADVDATEVEIYDYITGELIYMGFADADSNTLDLWLEPDTQYTIVVRHFGDTADQTNEDGMMCRYGTFSQYTRDFRTGFYSNLWRMVDFIDIVKGRITTADGDVIYGLEVSLESRYEGWYTTAWIKAASNAAFDDAHELRVDYDNYDPEMYVRSLEIESANISDVAEFVDGQWYLKIQTPSGTQQIALNVSGLSSASLTAPVITSPTDGNPAVLPGTPITWEPVTDPDVIGIEVIILDSEGNIVEESELPASATEYLPKSLYLSSNYTVRVAAVGNESFLSHEEGFEYVTLNYEASEISFATAASDNVWDLLGDVAIEQSGQAFEIIVNVASDGWFESLQLQDLSGNWHDLSAMIKPVNGDGLEEGEFIEYAFMIAIDAQNASDFGAGSYSLRLTMANGSEYSTTLEFSDQLAAPASAPVFVDLVDGQSGYDPSSGLMWQAANDPEVDEIWLMLEDADGNELLDEVLGADATSFAAAMLGGESYTATLTFVNYTTQTNADGLAFGTAILSETKASFETTSPMENIFEVFIDQGVEYTNGLNPEYSIEFGFEAMADSVTSARFRLEGANTAWVNLTQADGNVDSTEWVYEVDIDTVSQLAAWSDSSWIFEFTFANGQVMSTSLSQADDQTTGGALAEPTQIPQFENIYSNMTLRGGMFEPQWSAIIDQNVTSFEIEIESMYDTVGDFSDDTSMTSFGGFYLETDTVYFASLLFDNAREGQTDDGVGFFVNKYISNTVEFNTYASLFDSLTSIELHASDIDGAPFASQHVFGFEIAADSADLINGAHLITPDGTQVTLEPSVAGQQDYRWSYNAFGSSADFAYGSYTLVLFSSEVAASTTFEYSGSLAAMPADTPVFTAPAAGDTSVRPNATIAWQAPTDANTSEVHLRVYDESGTDVIDTSVATDQTELAQGELGFNTAYTAELNFANFYSLTSDLGVDYSVSTSTSGATSFTTARQLRPLDVVSGVFIQRGYMDMPAGVDPFAVFAFGMTTIEADQIISAQLVTPTAQSYDLVAADAQDPQYGYLWSIEQTSSAVSSDFGFGDMSDFISGTYTLQLQINDIETVTTSFLLDASIAAPATPEFTNPLDGADDVSDDVRLQWNPVTDAANLSLTLTDLDAGQELISTILSPFATKYAQELFSPQTSYSAELIAANGYASLANADGISFSVSMYSGQRIEFMTVEPFDPVSELQDVSFSKGYVSDSGQTKLAFSFGFDSGQAAINQARLQSPDGQWYTLTNDGSLWNFDLESATAADLAGFTSGVYTLEMTSATGQLAKTVFEVSGMQPPLPPAMLTPAASQSDFNINDAITWMPSASSVVTAQSLIVTETVGGTQVYGQVLATDAASASVTLNYETAYTLELASIADAAAQSNADGVAFNMSTFAAKRVQFQTAVEINPLENIANVNIHAGMVAPSSGSAWFMLDVSLDLIEDDVFDSLEYQIDGQWIAASDNATISIATTDTNFRDTLLGAGVLPIRISYNGGDTVVTNIPLPAVADIPGAAATITSPSQSATDIAPSADITWTSDGSHEQLVLITEGSFSETPDNIIFEGALGATATSLSPTGLEYSTAYTVYVAQTANSTTTSGDGLSCTTDAINMVATEFMTVDATVDLTVDLGVVSGLADMNLWGTTGAAAVTVTNTGTSLAEGAVTVNAYLSTDGFYDPADTLIGSAVASVSLDAGASHQFSVDLEIPQQLDEGDYQLVIVVQSDDAITEDSITNNEVVGNTYGVEAPTVDLTGEISSVEFIEEGRVIAGYSGTVAVEVQNTGNIAASGNCAVTIYASTSETLDDTALAVGTKVSSVLLPVGSTTTFDVDIKIPTSAQTGYYYFFAVVDSANQIIEGDEYNNQAMWDAPVSIESQVVDLTGEITATSFGAAALAGTAGTLDITLINQGNWPIKQKVAITVYATTTGVINAQSILVGQGAAKEYLPADGGMEDVTVKVVLPKTMANGDYYFVAVIDSTELVTEQNEANNAVVSATTLSVEEPFIDLTGELADTGFTEQAIAGDSAVATLTVTNNGNIKAKSNAVYVNIYLSTTLDIQDGVLVTQQKIKLNLDSGLSNDYSIKLQLPEDLATAYYYMIAEIDADIDTTDDIDGNIDESSEMNNTVVADTQVNVVARQVDFVATIADSTLHTMPMPGSSGKITVNIANDGNVPNDKSNVVVNIYGSLDGTFDPQTDMLLGSVLAKNLVIAAGDSRDIVVNVSVPDDATGAVYNMIAVVDVEDAVDELDDELNNQATETAAFEVVEPFTDLACEVTGAEFDDAVLPGDRGKVTVTITNIGNIPARDKASLVIYASDSDTIGAGNQVEIASMTLGINLGPDSSKDFGANVTVPIDIEQFENLYFIAEITPSDSFVDDDATNNAGALGGPALADPVRDLTGEIVKYKLDEAIIAGDRCDVRVSVGNEGNVSASGEMTVGVYAKATGDPLAVGILIGEAITENVSIAPGGSRNFDFRLEIPDTLESGVEYQFYVDIDTADTISEVSESNNTVDIGLPTTYVQRFGTFGSHRNEALTLTDGLGNEATFTIVGDGYGEVTNTLEGNFEITLTGTSAKSRFIITPSGDQPMDIYSIDADGDLGTIDAGNVNLLGSINVLGGLSSIELKNVADQHELTIGGDGSMKTSMEFNDVTDLNITTDTPIQSLSVNSWTDSDGDDTIIAPTIGAISSDGDFMANLILSGSDNQRGDTLGSVRIAGSVNDGDDTDIDWDVSGSIGLIDLAGSVDNFSVAGESAKTIMLGDAASIELDITGELLTLKANSLYGGEISAGEIRSINTDSVFAAALDVAGDLGSVNVGLLSYGDSSVTDWDVAGSVGTVSADSISNFNLLAADGIKSINAGTVTNSSLGDDGLSVGDVTLIKVDNWTGGEIVADSIVNLASSGDFSADMTVGVEGETAFKVVKIDGGITGGTWAISGDMGVFTVGGALSDWTLDLGTAELKKFSMGAATNVSIIAGEIGTVLAGSWAGGTVTADIVKAINVSGDISFDMDIAEDVGSVKTSGDITGGTWEVDGQIASVLANNVDAVDITAGSIKGFTAKGDMTDAAITTTDEVDAKAQALGKLSISGTMDSSEILSTGSIGSVVVGKMVDSVVFAGVKSDYATDANSDGVLDLPGVLDDYISPDADVLAQIKSITIRGSKELTGDLFANSSVAAGKINKAFVKDVTTDNASQEFGFAAVDGIKLTWQQGNSKYVFGKNWPDAATAGDLTVVDAVQAAPGSPWFHRS